MHNHIIPHNGAFTQVSLYENAQQIRTFVSPEVDLSEKLSPLQAEALSLYDAGLNVFPQPLGRKSGYPWKRLQYTRLERNHDHYGVRSLFAGRCNLAVMCGHTSGNLFVLDCETQATLDQAIDALRQRRIPLWVVRTLRGGHVYLRCREGEVLNISTGSIPGMEVRGQQAYVLGPSSIHPTGAAYEWLYRQGKRPPVVRAEEINWLCDASNMPVRLGVAPRPQITERPALTFVSPCSPLSRDTRDYLENGHSVTPGQRNNRLFSAACDLAGNAYPYHEAQALLYQPAVSSGLPSSEVQSTIRSAYSRERAAAVPAYLVSSDDATWKYAMLYVSQRTWDGRTGNSLRALMLALVERARVSASHSGVFRASVRELAVLARLGASTVQRNLNSLTGGILIRCGNDHVSGATLWCFADFVLEAGRKCADEKRDQALPNHWSTYSETVFNCDAIERGSVGHAALFVYRFLQACSRPMLPLQLSQASGLPLHKITYALRKLRAFNLIIRDPEGWLPVQIEADDLDRFVQAAPKGAIRRHLFGRSRRIFVGRLLYGVRVHMEGDAYMAGLFAYRDAQPTFEQRLAACPASLRDDPLIQCALELGGIVDSPHH